MAMNKDQPLWGRTDFILADLIDATNATSWYVTNKDVPKKNQSKFPEPYPRPGLAKAGESKVTAEQLLAHRKRTRRD